MRSQTRQRHLPILISLLLTSSCIDPFEADVPTQPRTIVVEGMLSDDPEFQSVSLRLHSPGDSVRSEISEASVVLERGDNALIPFEETEPGIYRPVSSVIMFDGEMYRLRVEIGDTVEIESGWQEVPPKIGLESAWFAITERTSINANGYVVPTRGVSYYVTTKPAFAANIFLRYSYISAYIMKSPMSGNCTPCTNCYIIAPAKNHIKTARIQNSIGKGLDNLEIAFVQPYQDYSIRKTLRILQFSINKETYDYYVYIERQKELSGSLFDPPPAVLMSNLTGKKKPDRQLYGLFEVNRMADIPVPVTRDAFSFHITTFEEVCTPNNLNTNPQCADCRVWPGATRERPEWF